MKQDKRNNMQKEKNLSGRVIILNSEKIHDFLGAQKCKDRIISDIREISLSNLNSFSKEKTQNTYSLKIKFEKEEENERI